MTQSRKSGVTAGLFALLLLANAVESRYLVSSSSSEDSASEAGTVLGFTATLSARRRSLLDRPASTCGGAAFPKDAEVEEIDTWLFRMADSLGLPRSACTAMGLQITAGAKSFTVFCLGNSGQLSAFSGGIVAGAVVSTGTTTMLHSFDITFDSGSKVTLEANLKTRAAPGLPDAVLECNVLLAVEGAVVIPNGRRHLLADPTNAELTIIAPVIDTVLNSLSSESGIPRNKWTATNAQVGADGNGDLVATFVNFVEAPPASGTGVDDSSDLINNWTTISDNVSNALGNNVIFGDTLTNVPIEEFPDLTISLNASLEQGISESLQMQIDSDGADVPEFTGTPSSPPSSTTPTSTAATTTPAPTETTTPATTETTTPAATETTTPAVTETTTPAATETTTPAVTETTTPAATETTTPAATETTTPAATETTTPAATETTTPAVTETTTPAATETTTPAATETTTPAATETTAPPPVDDDDD